MTDFEPYFKLATWDPRVLCFNDGKRGYPSEAAARADAKRPGRYRVSRVVPDGRTDLAPFDVAGTAPPPPDYKPPRRKGGPTATSLVFGKRYGK